MSIAASFEAEITLHRKRNTGDCVAGISNPDMLGFVPLPSRTTPLIACDWARAGPVTRHAMSVTQHLGRSMCRQYCTVARAQQLRRRSAADWLGGRDSYLT